jgi:type I site-specific restriction-modification system R (restriction) subunit
MSEANKKFSRVGFVVDRVNLVDQASAVLSDYGIDHGVIQAGIGAGCRRSAFRFAARRRWRSAVSSPA